MKHIIVEGGDNLGKDSLIKRLCEYYDYNNIAIRHFGKPPKGLSPKGAQEFQFATFYKEILFVDHIRDNVDGDEFGYFDNVIIWNRSHLGEYVYSHMFRGISKRDVKSKIAQFEKGNFGNDSYLITLTAGPQFFHSKEDGQSFSQSLHEKTRELMLFREIHDFSSIPNKKLIKVDSNGVFRPKDIIFKEVLLLLEDRNPIYE